MNMFKKKNGKLVRPKDFDTHNLSTQVKVQQIPFLPIS